MKAVEIQAPTQSKAPDKEKQEDETFKPEETKKFKGFGNAKKLTSNSWKTDNVTVHSMRNGQVTSYYLGDRVIVDGNSDLNMILKKLSSSFLTVKLIILSSSITHST